MHTLNNVWPDDDGDAEDECSEGAHLYWFDVNADHDDGAYHDSECGDDAEADDYDDADCDFYTDNDDDFVMVI